MKIVEMMQMAMYCCPVNEVEGRYPADLGLIKSLHFDEW